MYAHLLDSGEKVPRCVESCPTGTLEFADPGDEKNCIARLLLESTAEKLCPEIGLQEKVVYIGLAKRFISGTVIYRDKNECANDLEILLIGEAGFPHTRTNSCGVLEFDGLAENQPCTVTIVSP